MRQKEPLNQVKSSQNETPAANNFYSKNAILIRLTALNRIRTIIGTITKRHQPIISALKRSANTQLCYQLGQTA